MQCRREEGCRRSIDAANGRSDRCGGQAIALEVRGLTGVQLERGTGSFEGSPKMLECHSVIREKPLEGSEDRLQRAKETIKVFHHTCFI